MSDRPELEFYNPYHFIPVKGPSEDGGLDAAAFRAGRLGPFSHALDTRGRFSGRVVCRLTTEGETVVGGVQERVDAPEADLWGTGRKVAIPHGLKGCAFVRPFMLDGQPAIPAATLRGLVSSLAESVSQSALRVLDDAPLSVRAPINPIQRSGKPSPPRTLSALGMVIQREEGGEAGTSLLPLCLPTLVENEQPRFTVPSEWRSLLPGVRMKFYFGNYSITRTEGRVEHTSDRQIRAAENFCPEKKNFYWVLAPEDAAVPGREISRDSEFDAQWKMKIKGAQKQDGSLRWFLLGWELCEPLCDQPASTRPDNDSRSWIRGIVRKLGADKRDMPPSKKHELFIPFPPEAERILNARSVPADLQGQYTLLPVSEDVVGRFNLLADQRTTDSDGILPYEPVGTRRNTDNRKDDRTLRLKHGDVVYFGLDEDGHVDAVSFSANWRGWAGTVHQHFRALPQDEPVDPAAAARQGNLLPYGPERTRLTLAEMLFGFATDRSDKDRAGDHAAYAGRVRFGFGLPGGPVADPFGLRRDGRPKSPDAPADYAMMKILGSPKPPSPRLYFIHRKGRGVAKADLFVESKSASVFTAPTKPQGRKYYLHRSPRSPDWRSRSADENLRKQQNAVLPLREGVDFWFHLDFGNLDATELGLLLYALRPTDAFRHKLGMGKPLGLGTVRIDVAGLFLTDRYQRCAADDPFDAPRYHRAWRDPALAASWPDRYAVERAAAIDPALSVDTLRRGWRDGKDTGRQRAMAALECLGDPATVADRPVQMPYTIEAVQDAARGDPAALEAETFQWFVANEDSKTDGSRQYLRPLVPEGSETATLHPLRLLRKKDTGPKPKKIR